MAWITDIERTKAEIWRRTLSVHLDGTFFGCRAAGPAMKQGGASIIIISSTAALVGIAPYFAYWAAKRGIRSLTQSSAVRCRER